MNCAVFVVALRIEMRVCCQPAIGPSCQAVPVNRGFRPKDTARPNNKALSNMPLMEDHQDPYIDDPMDDLFGESEEIPLTAAPPIKGLALRLDELASTNCAQ